MSSTCLVAMPWQALESPSLPIGLLSAAVVDAGLPRPATYHANLRWAEFLLSATDGEIGPPEYNTVAENGLFDGLGDWVFTGVLHDDDTFGVATLAGYAQERGISLDLVRAMRRHAAAFIDLAATEILALRPDLVAFTSTFMQNVPTLALARRLKARAPHVRTVVGGGNCDGPMGPALHRNFAFLDFVVSGEGEKALPALLRALAGEGTLPDVAGLSWRDSDGTRHTNPPAAPLTPAQLPTPCFDDWFDRLNASPVSEYVEPKLILESARGCWWGEKHHCTFCGLNGTLMRFRAKAPDRLLAELTHHVTRHQVLDVIMVDNIIDNRYFTEVLPRVADLGWDLRVHYEVKSNLRPTEISALRRAGVAHVQPGIESLVTPVLRVMDKGVTGARNVRTLRDCESAGLTASWNWLYGFPGEQPRDYEPVLRQLPALVYLQPPAGASRILLERFSPYFDNPALGFPHRTTARAYRHVYALPETDVHDMVYLFDTAPAGLADTDAKPLHDLLQRWASAYPESSLYLTETADAIVVTDRRAGWPRREHHITDPTLRAAYRELEHGRTPTALLRRLAERHGRTLDPAVLTAWLDELASAGLVFVDHDVHVALATRTEPVKVT